MLRDLGLMREPMLFLVCTALFFTVLASCARKPEPGPDPDPGPGPIVDLEVSAHSRVSGIVNGEAVEGTIAANFNTGLGGSSTCTFAELPQGFSPASFGTHT